MTSYLKIQKCNTGNETVYVIHPRTIVYIIWTIVRWCISWIILPSTSVIGSLQLDIPLAFGSGYIYCKLPLTSVLGSIFAIYTSLLWFIYKAVRRSVNANWHFFSPKNCARRAGDHKIMIQAGSRMPSLSVPLARQIQTVVLALSWINCLVSQKFIIAICQGSG